MRTRLVVLAIGSLLALSTRAQATVDGEERGSPWALQLTAGVVTGGLSVGYALVAATRLDLREARGFRLVPIPVALGMAVGVWAAGRLDGRPGRLLVTAGAALVPAVLASLLFSDERNDAQFVGLTLGAPLLSLAAALIGFELSGNASPPPGPHVALRAVADEWSGR